MSERLLALLDVLLGGSEAALLLVDATPVVVTVGLQVFDALVLREQGGLHPLPVAGVFRYDHGTVALARVNQERTRREDQGPGGQPE